MNRSSVARRLATNATSLVVALAAGIAGVAGSYAIAGRTPAFVAAPVAGALARYLPGEVITFAITVLGDLGERLNLAGAVALVVVLYALLAFNARLLARGRVGVAPASTAGVVWLAATLTTMAPLLALGAALPAALVVAVPDLLALSRTPAFETPVPDPDRRTALGLLGVALGGGFLAALFGGGEVVRGSEEPLPAAIRGSHDRLLAQASDASLAVAGLEPLVSTEFYTVDINAVDPVVDAAEWTFSVTGAVEGGSIDYDGLRALPSERHFVSLRCVGEPRNGEKMDNALWEVVPIATVLDELGVELADNCCVVLRAADGFYEEFPASALMTGYLAYGMNGTTLPRGHGYPVRALIPGHWGEINVKWVTELEVSAEEVEGYWEKRGWHGTGPVNTVAKLHVENQLEDGRVQVAGHAYAGTRGVSRVEVSTDGGATWNDARLSAPLPGDDDANADVWRQWAYEYAPPAGDHEVVVRAVEADGTVQPSERANAFPSGAAGWVRRTVRV